VQLAQGGVARLGQHEVAAGVDAFEARQRPKIRARSSKGPRGRSSNLNRKMKAFTEGSTVRASVSTNGSPGTSSSRRSSRQANVAPRWPVAQVGSQTELLVSQTELLVSPAAGR
jgi:hypothetical protein